MVLGGLTGVLLWILTSGEISDDLSITARAPAPASRVRARLGKQLIEGGNYSMPKQGCVKNLLVLGDMKELDIWMELKALKMILQQSDAAEVWNGQIQCPAYNCNISVTLSANLSEMAGMDAVFLGMLGRGLKKYLEDLVQLEPPKGQTWFFFSTEPPFRVNFWAKKLPAFRQLKYHKMMTYRRDSDVYLPFGYYREHLPNQNRKVLKPRNYAEGKKDLIVWIGRNCGEVTWPRMAFLAKIQELLPLETYGKCGELFCYPLRSEQCRLAMRRFKFFLALANTECRDYITEKFWTNSLSYDIVPVVYGAPREDFEKVAPPNSFIHVSDFPSLESLAEYLRLLDQNDALYNSYFKWKERGVVQRLFPLTLPTVCEILPHLFNGTEQKVKRIGESQWYNDCRNPAEDFKVFAVKKQKAVFSSWTPWKLEGGR